DDWPGRLGRPRGCLCPVRLFGAVDPDPRLSSRICGSGLRYRGRRLEQLSAPAKNPAAGPVDGRGEETKSWYRICRPCGDAAFGLHGCAPVPGTSFAGVRVGGQFFYALCLSAARFHSKPFLNGGTMAVERGENNDSCMNFRLFISEGSV